MKKRILYLSFNDGSDMRINKEVRTLSQHFEVTFVGIGESPVHAYVRKAPLAAFHFIKGRRRSPLTLLLYFLRCIRLLISGRYYSIHVINEPQLLVLWPLLLVRRKIIVDIFDSVFLKNNLPGSHLKWLKWLVYLPAGHVIITDENRLSLLPRFLKKRSIVLPNFPCAYHGTSVAERGKNLTILYFGWLGRKRGSETVRGILNTGKYIRILMAGWIADEYSRELLSDPRVRWYGTLPQHEAMKLAASQADYILCVYAPVHDNNINASPNKIYDAIQTKTPVIINREVRIADFVRRHKIGYIMPSYEVQDYHILADDLVRRRRDYHFPKEMVRDFTWENVSDILVNLHRK